MDPTAMSPLLLTAYMALTLVGFALLAIWVAAVVWRPRHRWHRCDLCLQPLEHVGQPDGMVVMTCTMIRGRDDRQYHDACARSLLNVERLTPRPG